MFKSRRINVNNVVYALIHNRFTESSSVQLFFFRDVNAAKNILAPGLAVHVWRVAVRPKESKSRQAGASAG
ncbi:MAG: hypothetical protein ACK456_06035 [Pseudanabaenaceae cyanobacterium]|jgi:hypothetical protein